MTTPVRDVSAGEFADAVVTRSKEVPVVVDFWAAWCGPCRVLGPILESAAAESEGEWELVKVDVDQNQQLAMQFGVQGIPTVVGFRDGEPVARFTGALPEGSVRDWLRQLVPTRADRLAAEAVDTHRAGQAERAEAIFRQARELDPAHLDAATGLAEVLIETDRPDEALDLLAPLSPTEEVRRLQSTARTLLGAGDLDELGQAASDPSARPADRLAYARALAAAGQHERAMDEMLAVVELRDPDASEDARRALLDLFDTAGDADLVSTYRRRLANALF